MGLPAYIPASNLIECCKCGVGFWVTAQFDQQRLKDKQSFYCPNGHGQSYTESEADRLRRQLEQTKRELTEAESARQFAEIRLANEQARAKKDMKRVMRRANSGTCQHCHRTFSNVARHMETKHPECSSEAAPSVKRVMRERKQS